MATALKEQYAGVITTTENPDQRRVYVAGTDFNDAVAQLTDYITVTLAETNLEIVSLLNDNQDVIVETP